MPFSPWLHTSLEMIHSCYYCRDLIRWHQHWQATLLVRSAPSSPRFLNNSFFLLLFVTIPKKCFWRVFLLLIQFLYSWVWPKGSNPDIFRWMIWRTHSRLQGLNCLIIAFENSRPKRARRVETIRWMPNPSSRFPLSLLVLSAIILRLFMALSLHCMPYSEACLHIA